MWDGGVGRRAHSSATWADGMRTIEGTCVTNVCPGAELYIVDLQDLSSELILEQVKRAWYAPSSRSFARTELKAPIP